MLGQIKANTEGIDSDEKNCTTIDKLCITRWTVRSGCYKKIIDSYDSLYELWNECLDAGKLASELKGRIIGCQKQMEIFVFYYGLHLSHKFYAITDNLSTALQSTNLSALSGQR